LSGGVEGSRHAGELKIPGTLLQTGHYEEPSDGLDCGPSVPPAQNSLNVVSVLAEPPARCQSPRLAQDTSGEARESTKAVRPRLAESDSRGGVQTSLTLAERSGLNHRKRGRPRIPDDQASPDVLRMRKVYEQRRLKRREGLVEERKSLGCRQIRCGFKEDEWIIIPEFQLDVGLRYFWVEKRGYPRPPQSEEERISLRPRNFVAFNR
jgi:hypothetical protein